MAANVVKCFVEQTLKLLIRDLSGTGPDLTRLCEDFPSENFAVGKIRSGVRTLRVYAYRLVIGQRSA
jgi:hypothetical protein